MKLMPEYNEEIALRYAKNPNLGSGQK